NARESLCDLPPRLESELDPVTLHNQALLGISDNPTQSIQKLSYLLTLPANNFPLETFQNLLLSYVKYEYYDLAADILAEYSQYHKHLSKGVYEFIDAVITTSSSPAESYRKLDQLSTSHIEILKKFTREIQTARNDHNTDLMKELLTQYDQALEQYIP